MAHQANFAMKKNQATFLRDQPGEYKREVCGGLTKTDFQGVVGATVGVGTKPQIWAEKTDGSRLPSGKK